MGKKSKNDWVMISVMKKTRERLKREGSKAETYDDIINRIMNKEGCN